MNRGHRRCHPGSLVLGWTRAGPGCLLTFSIVAKQVRTWQQHMWGGRDLEVFLVWFASLCPLWLLGICVMVPAGIRRENPKLKGI